MKLISANIQGNNEQALQDYKGLYTYWIGLDWMMESNIKLAASTGCDDVNWIALFVLLWTKYFA